MSGIYLVAVRADLRHDGLEATLRQHVATHTSTVALTSTPFARAGYDQADLDNMLTMLAAIATHDGPLPGWTELGEGEKRYRDSEARPVRMYNVALTGEGEWLHDWLRPTEAAHETWPALLGLAGIQVSGMLLLDDLDPNFSFTVPAQRVPAELRLRSGCDYDANGTVMQLDRKEADRRLQAFRATRPH